MTELKSDEDGIDGSPWYVRAFIRVGMPTAFASAMLWFLLTNVTGNIAEVRSSNITIIGNQSKIIDNQGKIIELMKDHSISSDVTARFLAALCYNVATTPEQRVRCADAVTGRSSK